MTFTVYGLAQPKGNMRAIRVKGMKFPIVTESNRNAKSWQQLVSYGANEALRQLKKPECLSTPVLVSVQFFLKRPKRLAKVTDPVFHTTKPDADKLVRAVLDALTGVIFQDDSQVVQLSVRKDYAPAGEPPMAVIHVHEVTR